MQFSVSNTGQPQQKLFIKNNPVTKSKIFLNILKVKIHYREALRQLFMVLACHGHIHCAEHQICYCKDNQNQSEIKKDYMHRFFKNPQPVDFFVLLIYNAVFFNLL